jgi:hypothetical protein
VSEYFLAVGAVCGAFAITGIMLGIMLLVDNKFGYKASIIVSLLMIIFLLPAIVIYITRWLL